MGGPGASDGTGTQGGDGAALGGAIFVHAGPLTLAGSTSSSGSSATANGGLGAAIGAGIFMISGATVNFAPGDGVTMTFSELIADDSQSSMGSGTWNPGTGSGGSITMQGPGTLMLSGTNTYIGLTNVTGGRLNVLSSIPAGVSVSIGGTLGGTGIVYGGGTISGTLSPGTSVGTLTFETSLSNLTLDNTAVTNIDILPSAASKIVITGTGEIELNGSVNVSPGPGKYGKTGSYPILQGVYSGLFKPTITGGMNGYIFNLSYDTNLVNLLYRFVYTIPTQNLHHNRLKVANYINQAFADGYFSQEGMELFAQLDQTALIDALDAVSPARNAFAGYITQQMAFSLSDLITKHLDAFRMEKTASLIKPASKKSAVKWQRCGCAKKNTNSKSVFSGWVSGFGKYEHQAASYQNPAFNFWSGAALAGFDYRMENNGLMGTALGYAHSHFSEDKQMGNGNIHYYFVNLYGNAYTGNWYFAPSLWGIFNQTNNIRDIKFPGYSAKAKAHINAWQFVPHLEVGRELRYSWGTLTPFTSVDWAINWQRGYQEQGASFFNLGAKATSHSMLRSETGFKRSEKWEKSWGAFLLQEKIAYVFETVFGTGNVQTAFVGDPLDFTVTALQRNLNLADLSLDFSVAFGKKRATTLSFGYEGQVGAHYWANQVLLALNKDF